MLLRCTVVQLATKLCRSICICSAPCFSDCATWSDQLLPKEVWLQCNYGTCREAVRAEVGANVSRLPLSRVVPQLVCMAAAAGQQGLSASGMACSSLLRLSGLFRRTGRHGKMYDSCLMWSREARLRCYSRVRRVSVAWPVVSVFVACCVLSVLRMCGQRITWAWLCCWLPPVSKRAWPGCRCCCVASRSHQCGIHLVPCTRDLRVEQCWL